MALSTAFASFAAAPSPAVPTLASQVAHAKTPPGAISQTSLSTACVGIAASAAVLSSGRRGKKGASKIAMKDATYAFQKDVYADLEYLNDVGYLPDGTALNKAGNAINHPETIGADKHVAGTPLPRAKFVNSVGYLPDGTPMNAAGNAINHPERMGQDPHMAGSPLPASSYLADKGYLADGTDLTRAGNNSIKQAPVASAAFVGHSATSAPKPSPTVPGGTGTAMYGRKGDYSFQRDAYADQEFSNDVGYLPDGTPLNRAGNAINHPESIGPDRHTPGSPLPRANFMNSIGYLPDGTPMNRAGNNVNHPERLMPDPHTPGTPLPASCYAADAGYLVDGTPLEAAGNNSARMAPPQAPEPAFVPKPLVPPGAPVSSPPPAPTPAPAPAPVSNWRNSSDCLADGTPISRAGNNINHPDRPQAPVNNSGFARRAAAEEAPPSSTYLPY